MLAPDLVVELEKTATSTDVLAGTDLDQPIADGVAYMWVASTVNTATLEVAQPGHSPGNTQLITKRTDGIPEVEQQLPYKLHLVKGKRPIVVLGGTTGTCHFSIAAHWNRRG